MEEAPSPLMGRLQGDFTQHSILLPGVCSLESEDAGTHRDSSGQGTLLDSRLETATTSALSSKCGSSSRLHQQAPALINLNV